MHAATLTAVVVFPTPPFWFAIAYTVPIAAYDASDAGGGFSASAHLEQPPVLGGVGQPLERGHGLDEGLVVRAVLVRALAVVGEPQRRVGLDIDPQRHHHAVPGRARLLPPELVRGPAGDRRLAAQLDLGARAGTLQQVARAEDLAGHDPGAEVD